MAKKTGVRGATGATGFVLVKIPSALYEKTKKCVPELAAEIAAKTGLSVRVTPNIVVQQALERYLKAR